MLTSLLQPKCTTSNKKVTGGSSHFAWQSEDTRQVLSTDAQLTSHTKMSPRTVISCVTVLPPPCLQIYDPNKSKIDLQCKAHCDLRLWTNTSGVTEGGSAHLVPYLTIVFRKRWSLTKHYIYILIQLMHLNIKCLCSLTPLFQLRQIKWVLFLNNTCVKTLILNKTQCKQFKIWFWSRLVAGAPFQWANQAAKATVNETKLPVWFYIQTILKSASFCLSVCFCDPQYKM